MKNNFESNNAVDELGGAMDRGREAFYTKLEAKKYEKSALDSLSIGELADAALDELAADPDATGEVIEALRKEFKEVADHYSETE